MSVQSAYRAAVTDERLTGVKAGRCAFGTLPHHRTHVSCLRLSLNPILATNEPLRSLFGTTLRPPPPKGSQIIAFTSAQRKPNLELDLNRLNITCVKTLSYGSSFIILPASFWRLVPRVDFCGLTSLILSQPHYCVDWVHLCFYIPPPAVHLLCTFSFTLCPFSNCTYWIPLLNSSLLSLHFSPSTLRCNWRRRGRDMKGTRWGKRDSTKWDPLAVEAHFKAMSIKFSIYQSVFMRRNTLCQVIA